MLVGFGDSGSRLRLGSLFTMVLSLFSNKPRPSSVTHKPALPPSYPLAVRNPYLSTWMPSDQVESLPQAEPQFWAGQSVGWSVIARVDGQAYSLMGVKYPGDDILSAAVQGAEYTATHSIFNLTAGPVAFSLDFFSPVSPSNYVRQSLPFSYLTVTVSEAESNDIQVYSSIDGRWTGRSKKTVRSSHQAGSTAIYSLDVRGAVKYAENSDMALWGQAVFASRPTSSSKLSSSSGTCETVRSQFAKNGRLAADDEPWAPGGVVSLSHDLGTVTGDQSVNFAVGYVREEAINYLGKAYTGYYRAKYPQTFQAVSHFLDDYQDALEESRNLDSKMVDNAKAAAGQKYADIATLSARQAYGGIDLTIPNDSLDTDDVLAFIKELSSDGNINTVDVIMPAFPIYYILDPDYIRLLLEPMMRYTAAGRWRKPYTIHDMGAHYPSAIGHDDQKAEAMPIEESGNLLILALAYVRATNDSKWTDQYLDILRGYAHYLIDNGIDIEMQLSSNDAAGPLANETNLAIKAAVGIKAFGELSGLSNYSTIAQEHANLLFGEGLGTDDKKTHFVLQYPGKPQSWKTPYNLFPDVLLNLSTFPKAAYEMGNDFFSSVRGQYGVALDNRQDWAKSDWNIWLAGTLDQKRQDEFVDDLWAFMTNGKHNWPFSDRYVSTSAKGSSPGVPIMCRARPTVGGHFALMALQGPRSLQKTLPAMDKDDSRGQYFFGTEGEEL